MGCPNIPFLLLRSVLQFWYSFSIQCVGFIPQVRSNLIQIITVGRVEKDVRCCYQQVDEELLNFPSMIQPLYFEI